MKRLIVLTIAVTLLALLSGCGILKKKGAHSFNTTSPAPHKLQRLRLPKISLPWRRSTYGDCQSCNEGLGSSQFGGDPVAVTPVEGEIVEGPYLPGTIVESGYSGDVYSGDAYSGGTIASEQLFNPDVVYAPPVLESSPVAHDSGGVEMIPLPAAQRPSLLEP